MWRKLFRGTVAVVLMQIALVGCGAKRITLNYAPDTSLTTLRDTERVTVYAFEDRRDSEGDNDPFRVGGVYGGYGNRLSKVLADAPFQKTVANALVAALRARGIDAQVIDDRAYERGTTPPGTVVFAGAIKHFSTEARFTNSAHVRGIVRVYATGGQVLVEKDISEREQPGMLGGGVFTTEDILQDAMNKVLAKFVNRVATDPEIVRTFMRQ